MSCFGCGSKTVREASKGENEPDDLPPSALRRKPSLNQCILNSPEDDRNIRHLYQLMTHPSNTHCADCGSEMSWESYPWAVANHRVIVCMECSGCHRSMGASISKVKSLHLDSWNKASIDDMKALNNEDVNDELEYFVPADTLKPNSSAPQVSRLEYIRRKYADMEFARSNNEEEEPQPPELEYESEGDKHAQRKRTRTKSIGQMQYDCMVEVTHVNLKWSDPIDISAHREEPESEHRDDPVEAIYLVLMNGSHTQHATGSAFALPSDSPSVSSDSTSEDDGEEKGKGANSRGNNTHNNEGVTLAENSPEQEEPSSVSWNDTRLLLAVEDTTVPALVTVFGVRSNGYDAILAHGYLNLETLEEGDPQTISVDLSADDHESFTAPTTMSLEVEVAFHTLRAKASK